jgi:AMMECR1 domain-containing protein
LSRNERGVFGALKSDSRHFFRNACTKSGCKQRISEKMTTTYFQRTIALNKGNNKITEL